MRGLGSTNPCAIACAQSAYTGHTMRRAIAVLIVWLLAVALPAQGLAAATMRHCSPQRSHTTTSAQAGYQHPGAAHAQHHHDAGAAHDHGSTSDHHASVKTPLQKCSACAACCIGAALPSSAQSVPEPLAAPGARPEPVLVHAAFLTSGPDRPPRTPHD
jgi:hypothetical protein